ncbi:flagellar assembly protein FliW [Chitinimonas sp.]|uniref:flagellar assembly protein FliW n=1 Tax=Chitinimonas sp. TaxID=1934313 RepID=UPI002F9437CF
MQVTTPRFGVIEIDESTVITFPEGLPGFEACTRFKLLHEESPDPKVMWLQSLDEPSVVFSVIDSRVLGLNFNLRLSDEEMALIDNPAEENLALLLTLIRDGAGNGIRANTQAPILLNVASRLAFQKGGVRAEIVFTNE